VKKVKGVLDGIASAVGLDVGLAIGQTQMATEAAELVRARKKCVDSFSQAEADLLDSPESCVDILVATPGRLMDHVSSTKGFTLEHLRYLVRNIVLFFYFL
jgi:ATP-dependent RNA helicase DDX51/DBP6